MKAKFAVAAAVLAAVGYLILAGDRASRAISGGPAGWLLGGAVLVVVALTAALIGRELAFGWSADSLSRAAERERLLDRLPADPAAAFEVAKQAVETQDDDWQAWFLLGVAYELNRDRKAARGAMRHAIKLRKKSTGQI